MKERKPEMANCPNRDIEAPDGELCPQCGALSFRCETPQVESPLRFDTAILSDIGTVRQNNEDCGAVLDWSAWRESAELTWGMYLVADGMGGERAGEVASAKAVEEISSYIWESIQATVARDGNELVIEAINRANHAIYVLARDDRALSSMGTTATLGLRIGNKLYIGHVGDSRAYLIHGGKIQQLTGDHSLVASLVKSGLITPDEAKVHPDRGRIFRSLGSAATVVVDTLKGGDAFLLPSDSLVFCTDGVTGQVGDGEILDLVVASKTALGACRKLVSLANARGGDDNITVIVVKVGDSE